MVESHVAHVFRFLHSRHGVEDILSEDAVVVIWIDGEISHTERSKVLEEVRSLTRIHPIVLQSQLHNQFGSRDMRPLHRYAKPMVARPPTPWAHKHIALALIEEFTVDALHIHRNIGIVHCREIVIHLHIHHIRHILTDTMPERVVRAQQALLVGNLRQVLLKHLLAIHNRTNLQQIEFPRLVVVDITCKLYLHRALHLLLTKQLRHLQQLGQWEYPLLQHSAEGDNLASALIYTVAYHLVVGVVGRCYIVERPVLVGLLHSQVLDIKSVVHLEVLAHVGHVQGIESRLRVPQGSLHLACLQHLVGMIRTHAQGLSAIHDIFSQSQCQTCNTLLSLLVADGVIIDRAQHTAEVGIVVVAILMSHHLLQYHSHLLLVYHIARGSHICLRVLVIHRCIHALDGASQHPQHLILVLAIGYHVCGIYSRKRLIMTVLKQRRRTDGYRRLHRIKEGEEVGNQRVGQLRPEEMLQYLVVRGVAQGNMIEVVLVHKLVEDISAEHHRARYAHRHSGKLVELRMLLYHIVEECQSPTLTAERTVADAGEVAVGVKLSAVEHCHHSDVLHVAILHNGVEDNLSVGIHVLQLSPRHMLQECRHGEDGPCTQPSAHVIARDMVEHRVVGYLEDIVLQLLQRPYSHYLLMSVGVAEDKVAESHVLLKYMPQVNTHLLGCLIHKAEVLPLGLLAVCRFRALQYERHKLVPAPYLAQQFESCLGVFLHLLGRISYALPVIGHHAVDRESRVAYHS